MRNSLTFLKGTDENGTKWHVSLRAKFDGTAIVDMGESVTRNGERLTYDLDDQEFPSYRAAQLFALDLVKKRKADGFIPVDEEESPSGFEEKDAAAGRYVPDFLIGSFDLRKDASPHNANLHDISGIYALSHFPGCGLPPVHVATLDLSKINIFPEKVRAYGRLHIFYSNHEDCDAWMLDNPDDSGSMSFRRAKDGRLTVDNAEAFEKACDDGEPGEVHRGSEWDLFLEPPDADRMDVRGLRVGGPPAWWQSDQWPACPDCEETMFFIAEIRAIQIPPGNAGGDELLNIFLCEECGVGTTVMQVT